MNKCNASVIFSPYVFPKLVFVVDPQGMEAKENYKILSLMFIDISYEVVKSQPIHDSHPGIEHQHFSSLAVQSLTSYPAEKSSMNSVLVIACIVLYLTH